MSAASNSNAPWTIHTPMPPRICDSAAFFRGISDVPRNSKNSEKSHAEKQVLCKVYNYYLKYLLYITLPALLANSVCESESLLLLSNFQVRLRLQIQLILPKNRLFLVS